MRNSSHVHTISLTNRNVAAATFSTPPFHVFCVFLLFWRAVGMFQSRRGFFGKDVGTQKLKIRCFFFFPLVLEKLTPRFAK